MLKPVNGVMLFLSVLLLIPFMGVSQLLDGENRLNLAEPKSNFHVISTGVSAPSVRDFATSPLFHSGIGGTVGFGFLKRSVRKETMVEMNGGYGLLQAQIPKSDFLQPTNTSTIVNVNFRFLQLWQVKIERLNHVNFKLGGAILSTQNIRINSALQNNSLGREHVSNLMLSGQISRDVSRKEAKRLNLLFYKPVLKPVKREVRFQLNAGLLNFNYRPNYAYLFHESMGNADKTRSNTYQFSMNGWRLNTELELLKYYQNGNARGISYVWDAANVPGAFESLQLASHTIRYSYYFRTK